MDLILKVQWQWGGSKIVRTCASCPVSDVLAFQGFSPLENTTLLVAHKGHLVDPLFSFQYHNVQTGDRLVCMLKRLPSREKSSRFRESVSPTKRVVCQLAPISDPAEANRRAQIARLTDLSFLAWEAMPDGQLVMEDMLRQQERQAKDRVGFAGPTVVPESRGMSEAPLPNCFHSDAVLGSGVCKGKQWPPGFVKDLSDQPRRGSPFDWIKKQ
jgi:hypothetical protein